MLKLCEHVSYACPTEVKALFKVLEAVATRQIAVGIIQNRASPRTRLIQDGARTALSARCSGEIVDNTRTWLSALLSRDSWISRASLARALRPGFSFSTDPLR